MYQFSNEALHQMLQAEGLSASDLVQKKTDDIIATLRTSGVDDKKRLDPMTILMVISLIINVVRLWHDCKKKPSEAHEMLNSLGPMKRAQLRYMITKEMAKRSLYHFGYAKEVQQALIQVGQASTESEISTLMSQYSI